MRDEGPNRLVIRDLFLSLIFRFWADSRKLGVPGSWDNIQLRSQLSSSHIIECSTVFKLERGGALNTVTNFPSVSQDHELNHK